MNRHASLTRLIVALGAAFTLTLAACGGSDDTPAAEPATETLPPAATEPPAATPAPSTGAPTDGTFEISIEGFAFSGVTEVPVGTTVTVTNNDTTTHTWTADGGAFDSGGLAPGESFEFTFTEASDFTYFCAIHPNMTGTIVVAA